MEKTSLYGLVVVAIAMMLGANPAFAEDGVRLAAGFDYSNGKYGNTTTTAIRSVPVTGSYENGPYLLKLTVPYIEVTTGGSTHSGLGDIVAAAGYNLLSGEKGLPLLDVTGKVKFGTANSHKGLGTGENDYSLQADIAKVFGKFTALGTLGYRWNGDTSSTNFRNVVYGSAGGSYKFTPEISGGALFSGREASQAGNSAESDFTAFAGYKFTKSTRLQVHVTAGLSSGSPDIGAGSSISTGF